MSIQSRLNELGIPKMEGKAGFYHQIGTALITFALLGILGWVSLVFGKVFGLSFAWILSVVLLSVYFLNRVEMKLLVGTAVTLVALIIVSNIVDGIFTPMLGLFVFVISLVVGWLMQQQAYKMQNITSNTNQQMKAATYAPLALAAALMQRFGLGDAVNGNNTQPHTPVQQPTQPQQPEQPQQPQQTAQPQQPEAPSHDDQPSNSFDQQSETQPNNDQQSNHSFDQQSSPNDNNNEGENRF